MYRNIKYELRKLEKLVAKGVSRVEEPDDAVYQPIHGRGTIVREIERIKDSLVLQAFISMRKTGWNATCNTTNRQESGSQIRSDYVEGRRTVAHRLNRN